MFSNVEYPPELLDGRCAELEKRYKNKKVIELSEEESSFYTDLLSTLHEETKLVSENAALNHKITSKLISAYSDIEEVKEHFEGIDSCTFNLYRCSLAAWKYIQNNEAGKGETYEFFSFPHECKNLTGESSFSSRYPVDTMKRIYQESFPTSQKSHVQFETTRDLVQEGIEFLTAVEEELTPLSESTLIWEDAVVRIVKLLSRSSLKDQVQKCQIASLMVWADFCDEMSSEERALPKSPKTYRSPRRCSRSRSLSVSSDEGFLMQSSGTQASNWFNISDTLNELEQKITRVEGLIRQVAVRVLHSEEGEELEDSTSPDLQHSSSLEAIQTQLHELKKDLSSQKASLIESEEVISLKNQITELHNKLVSLQQDRFKEQQSYQLVKIKAERRKSEIEGLNRQIDLLKTNQPTTALEGKLNSIEEQLASLLSKQQQEKLLSTEEALLLASRTQKKLLLFNGVAVATVVALLTGYLFASRKNQT